jgi:hypothetical protein
MVVQSVSFGLGFDTLCPGCAKCAEGIQLGHQGSCRHVHVSRMCWRAGFVACYWVSGVWEWSCGLFATSNTKWLWCYHVQDRIITLDFQCWFFGEAGFTSMVVKLV